MPCGLPRTLTALKPTFGYTPQASRATRSADRDQRAPRSHTPYVPMSPRSRLHLWALHKASKPRGNLRGDRWIIGARVHGAGGPRKG